MESVILQPLIADVGAQMEVNLTQLNPTKPNRNAGMAGRSCGFLDEHTPAALWLGGVCGVGIRAGLHKRTALLFCRSPGLGLRQDPTLAAAKPSPLPLALCGTGVLGIY